MQATKANEIIEIAAGNGKAPLQTEEVAGLAPRLHIFHKERAAEYMSFTNFQTFDSDRILNMARSLGWPVFDG